MKILRSCYERYSKGELTLVAIQNSLWCERGIWDDDTSRGDGDTAKVDSKILNFQIYWGGITVHVKEKMIKGMKVVPS